MSAFPKDDTDMFEDSVIANILESIRDISTSLGNLAAKQESIDKTLDKVQENVANNTKEITEFKAIEKKIPNIGRFIRWVVVAWGSSIIGIGWLMWHVIRFVVVNFPQVLH